MDYRVCKVCLENKPLDEFRKYRKVYFRWVCGICEKLDFMTRNKLRSLRQPLYETWKGLVQRTTNPNCTSYLYYGGRGITMCEEWRNSYQAFEDYLGDRPSPQHSIDRIDNDGNYEPGNVRWATRTEQQNNRRNKLVLTYNGLTKPLTSWAAEKGISYQTLVSRVKAGWAPDRVLSEVSKPAPKIK